MVPIFGYDTLPVFTKMPVEMGGESEDLRAEVALKKSPPKPWELTHLLDPCEMVSSVAACFQKCIYRGQKICNLAQLLPKKLEDDPFQHRCHPTSGASY